MNIKSLGSWAVHLADRYSLVVGLVFCLIAGTMYRGVGFSNPLVDQYAFRQTQTAITSYYFIKDGFKLAYETPVLGRPWPIPIEFPLYQGLVAEAARLGGWPLDQTGRVVSLVFFYLSLIIVYLIGRNVSLDREQSLLAPGLILVSPLYIFWSRSFLIEPAALFFGLAQALCFLRLLQKGGRLDLVLAVLFGALAALTKFTTFLIIAGPLGLVWLWRAWISFKAWRAAGRDQAHLAVRLAELAGLVLPFLVGYAWMIYSAAVRSLNHIGGQLTNDGLTAWSMGTLAEKFSWSTWKHIIYAYLNQLTGNVDFVPALFGLALLLALAFNRRRLGPVLLCLLAFACAPLVFTHLYFVHNYYWYANGAFFLMALAFGLAAVMDFAAGRWLVRLAVFPFLAVVMLVGHHETDQFRLQKGPYPVPAESLFLRAALPEDQVVMIFDHDWDSTLAYYAQRRALMRPPWADPERFEAAIKATGPENIAALVKKDRDEALIKRLDLLPEPVFQTVSLRRSALTVALARLFQVDLAASEVSGKAIKIIQRRDGFALVPPVPSRLAVPLAGGGKKFKIAFGVLSAAGAEVSVSHVRPDGQVREVFRRRLWPEFALSDRETQTLELDLSSLGPGRLILEARAEAPGREIFWSSPTLR